MSCKYVLAATLLLGGASVAQASSVINCDPAADSSMSLSKTDLSAVLCLVSDLDNITDGSDGVAWLLANGATSASFLYKTDAPGGTSPVKLQFDGTNDVIGEWEATTDLQNLAVAFKYDAKPVEFHFLGDVAGGTMGYWETSATKSKTGCTIGQLLSIDPAPTGGCSGFAALSNVSYYTVAGPDFPGGDPVPLPAAVWLFGSAILGVVGIGYRRKRQA